MFLVESSNFSQSKTFKTSEIESLWKRISEEKEDNKPLDLTAGLPGSVAPVRILSTYL